MLGIDSTPNVNIQEAFGSLLNAHDILSALHDTLSDEAEGEIMFRRVYEKLHHPTQSVSGSLASSTMAGDEYFRPTSPYALGAAVEVHLKLNILKGLFAPFEVVLTSNKGLNVNQYLQNPFLSPENDPKLRSIVTPLSIERWTDAFIVYMHFFCMRFLEQREHMHRYIHLIRSMEQSAPPGAWMGYDREFWVMRQSKPSLP